MTRRPRCGAIIRFSDCDPFGHLYNVRYLDYLFDGREQHVASEYPLLREAMKSRLANWVVTANDVRYLAPVAWGEQVFVESSVLSATRNSVLLEILMGDEHKPKALLWSRLTYLNLQTGKVVNHSEKIQSFIDEVVYPIEVATVDERARELLRSAASRADRPAPQPKAVEIGSSEDSRHAR